jgi:hypothetical protein
VNNLFWSCTAFLLLNGMMKKDPKHRKRHTPPGPCGVWYQTQQQLRLKKTRRMESTATSSFSLQRETSLDPKMQECQHHDDDDNDNGKLLSQTASSDESRNVPSMEDVRFSLAWKSMMVSLHLKSPDEIQAGMTIQQRYGILRSSLPPEYVLLYEILRGDHDLCVQEPSTRLLVLVHSVESHIHHNIWTVELQDESGATIRAWIEPKFVQEQMKEQVGLSMIRPGVAWMLRKVSIIVVSNDQEEKVERMLLISGKHVEQAWTPELNKDQQQQQPFIVAPTQASPTAFNPEDSEIVNCVLNVKQVVARSSTGDTFVIQPNDQRDFPIPQSIPTLLSHSENGSDNIDPSAVDVLEDCVSSSRDADMTVEKMSHIQQSQFGRDAWQWLDKQSSPQGPPVVSSTPKTVDKSSQAVSGKRPRFNLSRLEAQSDVSEDMLCTDASSPPIGGRPDTANDEVDDNTAEEEAAQILEPHTHDTTQPSTSGILRQACDNLWNVQDSSILAMLDDADDFESVLPAVPRKPSNESQRLSIASDSLTSSNLPETSSIPSDKQQDAVFHREQHVSLFEPSNFESIDMSEFSDND